MLCLVTHYRNMHFCLPQVARHLDVSYGDVSNAWVLQIGEDRHAHDFTNGFGCFLDTSRGHGEAVLGSRLATRWEDGLRIAETTADFFDLVGFEYIAFFEVVVADEFHAALEPLADLANIVLFAAQ